MKKILSGLLFSLALLLLSGNVPVSAASSAGGVVTLCDESVNFGSDVYSQLDVTGDGAKDVVAMDVTDTAITLKVNDQVLKTWDRAKEIATAQIVTVAGKSYIELNEENYVKYTTKCGLYLVSGGKLKKAVDYSKFLNKKLLEKNKFVINDNGRDMITVSKVKGKKLYLKASLYTKSLGYFKVDNLQLKYSGGKFKLTEKAGKTSFLLLDMKTGTKYQEFTAKKSVTVFKKAGSSEKAGFKIAANKKFTIKKAAVVKKNIYVQVKSGGKTGWIKLGKSNLVKMRGMLVYGA